MAEAKATTEKKVKIKLRKSDDSGKILPDMFVAVNRRTFQIQRGVAVEVPECVKEIIDNAEEQREAALGYIADNAK